MFDRWGPGPRLAIDNDEHLLVSAVFQEQGQSLARGTLSTSTETGTKRKWASKYMNLLLLKMTLDLKHGVQLLYLQGTYYTVQF